MNMNIVYIRSFYHLKRRQGSVISVCFAVCSADIMFAAFVAVFRHHNYADMFQYTFKTVRTSIYQCVEGDKYIGDSRLTSSLGPLG